MDCSHSIYGQQRDKTCLQGFRQSETQTSLHSYRDQLKNLNFACIKLRYDTFQKANNKGTDQSARMGRLVCACVVPKPEDRVSRIQAHINFSFPVSRVVQFHY